MCIPVCMLRVYIHVCTCLCWKFTCMCVTEQIRRSENNLRYHLPSYSRPSHFAVSGFAPQINWPEGSYSLMDRCVQMSHCRGIDFPVESRPKSWHACNSSLLFAAEGDPWAQSVTVCSTVIPQRMSGCICSPATSSGSVLYLVCRRLCDVDFRPLGQIPVHVSDGSVGAYLKEIVTSFSESL